jgi:hypothetical protein
MAVGVSRRLAARIASGKPGIRLFQEEEGGLRGHVPRRRPRAPVVTTKPEEVTRSRMAP